MAADLSVYLTESVFRSHHVFKQVWSPVVGEVLTVDRKRRNAEDRYTFAVVVQVIIPVESHYFQLEFTRITLLPHVSCFHHISSHPTRVACLKQRSACVLRLRRAWSTNSLVISTHFY